MKKITIIVAALAFTVYASAFSPYPVFNETTLTLLEKNRPSVLTADVTNKKVLTAFTSKFRQADKVTWKQVDEIYIANFEMNTREFAAAYSKEGEMIAVSRKLTTDQLPLIVLTSLEERFEGYKLPGQVTEIIMDGATSYYLTLEGATRFLQIKCSADGSVKIDKKIKKKILVGSVS